MIEPFAVGGSQEIRSMVAGIVQNESEFALFGRFVRAFSHVMRGDLSVVTNEVSYLATQAPSAELGHVRNRCSQMAATISKLAALQSEVAPALVSSEELVTIFGAQAVSGEPLPSVLIDRMKIGQLAAILQQMIPANEAKWIAQSAERLDGSFILLTREISHSGSVSSRYSSWSSFASKELGERSVIDGVVADLIMRAHGWDVSISLSQHLLSVELRIPLVAAESYESRCA